MEGASYSRCELGLRGFSAALISVTEMVYEAYMGAKSVVFLLCSIFSGVHCSGVFQEYT